MTNQSSKIAPEKTNCAPHATPITPPNSTNPRFPIETPTPRRAPYQGPSLAQILQVRDRSRSLNAAILLSKGAQTAPDDPPCNKQKLRDLILGGPLQRGEVEKVHGQYVDNETDKEGVKEGENDGEEASGGDEKEAEKGNETDAQQVAEK